MRNADISKDNLLRQRYINNSTYTWNNGPLNDLNIKTLDSGPVGLQVCFYEGPIDNVNLNGTDPHSGMRLWIATSETTFAQYAWRAGLPSWVPEQSLWIDLNGHASPACYGWGKGSTTYVMFVDNQNDVQLYWYVCFFMHSSNMLTPPEGKIHRIMSRAIQPIR